MINQEEQDRIETDKIYIPENYINSNYKYYINGDYVNIITNNNCYTNYNTQYCDCYNYNWKNNMLSMNYACNSNPTNNNRINYNSITADKNESIFYREIYTQTITGYVCIGLLALLIIVLLKGD